MTVLSHPIAVPVDVETADFDYTLPPELIAQTPLAQRSASRLLVLEKDSGVIHHSFFKDLADWLAPGDLLVANNSRVIPARLRGFRLPTGGGVELLLLRPIDGIWSALAKPAKRLGTGSLLEFPSRFPDVESAFVVVEENLGNGELRIRFENEADQRLDAYGTPPLPPYIARPLIDETRYQTVYGRIPGSAAAPTAGLHFTDDSIGELRQRGIDWAELTLHIGIDTFRPVTERLVKERRIHREWYEVPAEASRAISAHRRQGGRIVAVGTTAARALETVGKIWRDDTPRGFAGFTDTFIVPGHRWQLVDAMLTNFHLPRSTLLMLVSALAGREAILRAYGEAARRRYRFFSFGDAMLIR